MCLSLYISDKKLPRDTVAKVLLNRGPRLPQNRRRPFVRIETTAALRRRRAIGCLVLVLSMPLTSSYTLSGLPGLASVLRTPSGETKSLLWSLLQKPCCSSTYQTVFSRLLRAFWTSFKALLRLLWLVSKAYLRISINVGRSTLLYSKSQALILGFMSVLARIQLRV
jgi:hypothetical protein